MKLHGKAHKFGDNINTDVIIPARYLNISDPAELARHCMEGIDSEFISRVQPGDIILAGANFGSGSSREHAPIAIKAAGISCVIAKSFARIFFRNAVNIGLPILECAEIVEKSDPGDTLEVELATGQIENVSKGLSFRAKPYPDFMLGIISAGGLVDYTKQRITRGL
jgi:3-isopropylmalate/(R)-2-methylmalate dehydratase small subunit